MQVHELSSTVTCYLSFAFIVEWPSTGAYSLRVSATGTNPGPMGSMVHSHFFLTPKFKWKPNGSHVAQTQRSLPPVWGRGLGRHISARSSTSSGEQMGCETQHSLISWYLLQSSTIGCSKHSNNFIIASQVVLYGLGEITCSPHLNFSFWKEALKRIILS